MKIKCIETGRYTAVKRDAEVGSLMIIDAMTRILRREPQYALARHHAAPVRLISFLGDFREYAACRRVEVVVCSVGGLTEHTGDFYTFEEIPDGRGEVVTD